MLVFGPWFLNLRDHNPQNQSKASFCSYKPCVKFLSISYYLYLSYYLQTSCLQTRLTTQTMTTWYQYMIAKILRSYKNMWKTDYLSEIFISPRTITLHKMIRTEQNFKQYTKSVSSNTKKKVWKSDLLYWRTDIQTEYKPKVPLRTDVRYSLILIVINTYHIRGEGE